MSYAGAAGTSPEARKNSENASVEIYIFDCGHGDTILIRLPGGHGVLVDCNLPKNNGVRDRFFEFVESNGIDHLEYIFQTHPDTDHFHGMEDVLDYFECENRSFGYWCDAGLNSRHVRGLIWDNPIHQSRYERLQKRLDRVDPNKFKEVGEDHVPITCVFTKRTPKGLVRFIPIAPNAGVKRQIGRSDIPKVAGDPQARVEANALSVVLVLSIQEGDRVCNVLLAADADFDSMELAFDAWEVRAREISKRPDLDVVKVPHHGSIKNHSTRLCQTKRNDRKCCVAAVSAGHRSGLPDRVVLREYLDAGWTVMVTTRRRRPARSNRPSELADRSPPAVQSVETHTISITVTADGVVAHEPVAAVVQTGDLVLYESGWRHGRCATTLGQCGREVTVHPEHCLKAVAPIES